MTWFLFPGQGSQRPGMCKDFYEGSPAARSTLDTAANLLGGDWLATMFEGPDDALRDTRCAQISLVAAGVAIARHLQTRGLSPDGVAGHSVGEITALVAADALDFETALALTRERARLMAGDAPPGTMAAVVGLDAAVVERILPEGAEIANFNGPAQTIISGPVTAVDRATAALEQAGATRVIPLNVSGPFHSSCMARAGEKLRDYLKDLRIDRPDCRFVSSVSGTEETEPDRIRELLGSQLAAPVRWTDVMRAIGPAAALETGPGNVLQGLAKRTDRAPRVHPAGTLAHTDTALAERSTADKG